MDGVTVRAHRWQVQDGRRQLQSAGDATTDDEGNFRIAELLPGSYSLAFLPANRGGRVLTTLKRKTQASKVMACNSILAHRMWLRLFSSFPKTICKTAIDNSGLPELVEGPERKRPTLSSLFLIPESITPSFSIALSHSFAFFFTLAEISPVFAIHTKKTRGASARTQNVHYSSYPQTFSMRSVSLWHSLPSVAVASPRCHTLISSAARILARVSFLRTGIRTGCIHWGFYGIARHLDRKTGIGSCRCQRQQKHVANAPGPQRHPHRRNVLRRQA